MTQLPLEFEASTREAITIAPTGMVFRVIKPLRPYRGARWRKPAFAGDLWISFIPHPDDEGEDGYG